MSASVGSAELAHDPTTLGPTWVKISIPLTVFTCFIVAVRVGWRLNFTGRLGKGDYCILVALAMAVIQLAFGCAGILEWGFGHHVAYLGLKRAQGALMYFYLYQIPYKILVSFTKLSFLYLYLDIFTVHPNFRMVCNITIYSVYAAAIAFTLTTTFQCTPIQYDWDKTIDGHCIDAPAFWYGHAGWNTAFDIFILCLPVPVIRSLQMPRNQKAALLGVFALGAFVCVTSIMRMVSLDIAAKAVQTDLTYSTLTAFIWTQVESCVGIICACLPTLKAPISRILPRMLRNKWTSANNAYNLEEIAVGGSGRSKSTTWKDHSVYRSQSGKESDGASSQERIMGIKKTVDISVTRGGEETMPPRNEFGGRNDFVGRDMV